MEDISFYFSPISFNTKNETNLSSEIQTHTKNNFPEIESKGIAILYVSEFRNSNFEHVANEKFRIQLHKLYASSIWNTPIFDLGNIIPGETVQDTYFAVSKIITELVKNDVIPIIIGGSQDLTIAMYQGYEGLEQHVNLCSVDSKLDLGNAENPIHADHFISNLLLKRPCYLFNHSNIGLQLPLVDQNEFELFNKLYFDYCRLGEFNNDFKRAEPLIRNSDILNIDFTSIRFSELNDEQYTNPNGFYANQICQIARYAGASDKLTSFGIFNYLPEKSSNKNCSDLVAQLIWYFIDGVNARIGDYPIGNRLNYSKFTVHLDDFKDEVIFYKSDKSARWWMEIPYPAEEGKKYERHYLVPCNKEDYNNAMNNEIPDLWWKTYQKLV